MSATHPAARTRTRRAGGGVRAWGHRAYEGGRARARRSHEHAWERAPWWHATFVLALLAASGVTLAHDVAGWRKVGAAVVLSALAAWYATVGRKVLSQEAARRGAVYLSGAFILVAALWVLTPAGWIVLLGLCPQAFTALHHVDRCWADHLAFLADLREGIHLRALGRGINPLDEYHREAIHAFRGLLDDVRDRCAETFETADITADGIDLEDAGLRRPTATWTYLVKDNPFGSEAERAMRGLGAALRGASRRT